jgi:hypothetical protein
MVRKEGCPGLAIGLHLIDSITIDLEVLELFKGAEVVHALPPARSEG